MTFLVGLPHSVEENANSDGWIHVASCDWASEEQEEEEGKTDRGRVTIADVNRCYENGGAQEFVEEDDQARAEVARCIPVVRQAGVFHR